MAKPKIAGICGALRGPSTNRKLLDEAYRLFGEAEFTTLDIRFPLYDGDAELADGIPAEVQRAADQLAEADAIIIATPEYNKGITGVLKNALDWISRCEGNPWFHKPVATMSAAAGRAGGERSQVMLRTCLTPFQPLLLQGPEVALHDSSNQFDDNGRLKGELYEKNLKTLMEKLRATI